MCSYAIVVGVSIVVSLGYSKAYVKCYDCESTNSPSFINSVECYGRDMTKVPTCVGTTCVLNFAKCSGTKDEDC